MNELINNPWWAALVVFITQIVFLYARTLNVMYVAEKRLVQSLVTGGIVSITWLISISIGVNAVMTLQWQPVIAYIIGSSVGVVIAFRYRRL